MAYFVPAVCVIVVGFLTGIQAEQPPSLHIQPETKTLSKEIEATFGLTCRPAVPDQSLVSQLEWRDPLGRRIDPSTGTSPQVQNLANGNVGVVLIFNGLTEQQGGNYSCHAYYAASIELESWIVVEPYVDIKFVDAPPNQFSEVGKTFQVKCKVRGNPVPTIVWTKNGEALPDTGKYVARDGELIINNVTESDDGVYRCTAMAYKTGQIKSRNIKVEVQVPPKIIPMSAITIIEGEASSAKCTATGKPPPTYKWIKVLGRQDLSKTDRFDVKNMTGELIINRVEAADDGEYECVAENPVARTKSIVRINVLVKPNIYELLNTTTQVETRAELLCKATGKPPPAVFFRKLSNREPFRVGQQLDDNNRIILHQQFFPEKQEGIATLVVSNVSRTDDGLYECIAENSAGTAYKNGHITVQFPPTFNRTKNLPPVWTWDGRPGNLSCLPEAIPNATITWRFRDMDISEENFQNGRLPRHNFEVIGTSPQSFLIVKPLNEPQYFTRYECIARNALGTASLFIQLKEARRPERIGEVKAIELTATTIKFSIFPPTNFDGLPVRSYVVRYKEESFLWDHAVRHVWSSGAPYILEGLIPERTYDFQFAAMNDVGEGPFINAQQITMLRRSQPAEPRILIPSGIPNEQGIDVVSPYPNHFELKWNVPVDNGEPIQHYVIKYCETEMVDGNWNDGVCSEPIKHSSKYTSYQFDSLKPNHVYKIQLRARNAIGDSSAAEIRVRTATGLDPIVPVSSTKMSSSTIIGIVVAAILLVLIVVDITCYCVNRTGVIALCCERSRSKKKDEEDPKLGSEETEPLKQEAGEKPMTVEFDGTKVYSKPGVIIGKHSAV